MDLFEAIEKRHSYRDDFTDEPVSREDLRKIVQAGIQAASAENEQVTSFVIVDDPMLLKRIAAVLNRPVGNTAKAMIVCVTDPRPVFHDISFEAEDCAACVSNMLLAVTALGYATVWLDGVLRIGDTARQIAQLLDVPADRNVRIILPIGRPRNKIRQKEKQPFSQRAWFNRYRADEV